MEELRRIFAKNLSDLRTQRGMTQLQLAEMLNYSDKAVSKWERGDSIPDVFVLKQMADYFGVTVDYFLTEDHTETEIKKKTVSKITKRNRRIITMLSASVAWLVVTLLFVILNIRSLGGSFPTWLLFVYAVPVSSIVLLVFNSIWGRSRANYAIITVLVWSLLASIFLSLFRFIPEIWLVFILGVPAQIIIFLWSGLRVGAVLHATQRETQKNKRTGSAPHEKTDGAYGEEGV